MILRAIRRALIISLFFAPPAHAWALAAAAVAWLAGTTTAAVAASTILSIAADALLVAASVGLSYIAKAIMGTPDGGFQGTSGKLTAGGVTPRTFLAGDASSGGLLVYHNTWGKDGKTPNAYYTQVVKISDLPITSLTQVLVGGVPVTWVSGGVGEDWGIPIPEYNQDGKDHLWLKSQ